MKFGTLFSIILAAVIVTLSLSGETGFSLSLSSLSGDTAHTFGGPGAGFLWRAPLGDGPFRIGCTAEARLFGPSSPIPVSNILFAAPVTGSIAYEFLSAPIKLRIGAGAGIYASYIIFAGGDSSFGVVPIIEPFFEIAFPLGSLDIVCIPSYTAIFDMVALNGTYAQEICFRAGILFGTKTSGTNNK
ncbi:MAG: hypothetical protein HZC28_08850 [Spirochaetes bacterium]|nr:hypothetical protein [Spirochaetota bacterium]